MGTITGYVIGLGTMLGFTCWASDTFAISWLVGAVVALGFCWGLSIRPK